MNYKTIPLSNAADIIVGFPFASEKFNTDGKGTRLVRGKNITTGMLRWGDDTRWWDDNSIDLSRYALKSDDIVIGMDGSLVGKNYAKISPNDLPLLLVQRVACVRAKAGYDQRFLWSCISSSNFERYIDSVKTGTSIPHISGSQIGNYFVPDFKLQTQKKISSVFSALDEKIAINRAINDNLEQQAQAFFQELFVDNADPEWVMGTISNLGAVVGGSTPSKAKPEYYSENGIAWITPKDLSINKAKFISHGENDITELGLKNSSATIMPEGTVLFSSRAPIGYIAIAAGKVTTNQGFKSIVPNPEIGTAFVYYFLKHNLPIIEGMASGSTFKEVSGSTMKGVPAVIPDTDTITRFNDFCAPIFAQQRILEEQNQSLTALRDNLLPRLMSGDIDVSGIQL